MASGIGRGSVAALVAAAGSGTRLGSGPKALVKLAGKTLLEHALDNLRAMVDELVVAVPAAHRDDLSAALPGVRVIVGGQTRQASVKSLLAACDSDLVVIHDVARPFLPAEVLERVITAAQTHGAASAAVAVSDTVVTTSYQTGTAGPRDETRYHRYGEVVDRDLLRAIQTPQAFARDLIAAAHAEAAEAGVTATDDAGLAKLAGHEVVLVEGSRLLLKITEPADLVLAEALWPHWRAKQPGPGPG